MELTAVITDAYALSVSLEDRETLLQKPQHADWFHLQQERVAF